MKLLMSKNGERGESPSQMKYYYKEQKKVGINNVQGWREERGSLSTKNNYQKQQKEGRIINLLDVKQECYETHWNGL